MHGQLLNMLGGAQQLGFKSVKFSVLQERLVGHVFHELAGLSSNSLIADLRF
jgi:hypothetical protein